MSKPFDSRTQDKLMDNKLCLVILQGRAATSPTLTSRVDDEPQDSRGMETDLEEVDALEVRDVYQRSGEECGGQVCIDQDNISDGLRELDKVCIDQNSIADRNLELDKVCIDRSNIADG